MATTTVRVGDVGCAFRLTVNDGTSEYISISGASSLSMRFRKPDGTVLDKTAHLVTDGFDGRMEYVTVSGDLSVPGHWHVQAAITLGASVYHSTVLPFTVEQNL